MHCHLEAHMDIGMAVVLQVGEISEQPKPPKDFPKCSNFKRESLYKSESKEHFNGFLQLPGRQKLDNNCLLFVLDLKKEKENRISSS